jgi:uncharacterized protein YecE (DUF72 family)
MRKRSPDHPSLFEPAKPTATEKPVGRTFPENMFVGTSAFSANGWQGSFYPKGTKSSDCLTYYATKFRAVEIDSTFYGPPAATTVEAWYRKTPPDFVFAAKVPQSVTHDKILKDCETEVEEFLERMHLLNEKLGPLLFQFPHFNKYAFRNIDAFVNRLRPFLRRVRQLSSDKLAVEVRNRSWLNQDLADVLRESNVALTMTDTSFVPRPWEQKAKPDFLTTDFAYIRWLGDRKGIEKITTSWDKTIVDRTDDLRNWRTIIQELVLDKKLRAIFAFANNHYAGHGPDTIKLFHSLWSENAKQ